jgi:hypothetical protein
MVVMNTKDVLLKILPRGSGIHINWEIEEISPESFRCYNAFHVMDGNGFYCGRIPFQCTIFLFDDREFGLFDVKITAHLIPLIYADYKLDNGELDDAAPSLDNLAGDIFERISRALEDYNEKRC